MSINFSELSHEKLVEVAKNQAELLDRLQKKEAQKKPVTTLFKNKKVSKLEKSEKRFRALVENNEGIITVLNKDFKTIFRSVSSARITGYSDEEFNAIQKEDYFHPDYLNYVAVLFQAVLDNPGQLYPALFQIKHKKGHYIWLEGVLNNKLNDKYVAGILANFRDVTEKMAFNRALQKERDIFAKIAATSPGLIYSMAQNLDGSLSYLYASEAISEIYGFTFEQIKNHTNKVMECIHPEDVTEINQKITNTKTKLVPLKGVYRYFHPTKGLVWHEVNSLPVVAPDGTVVCHGIITDITERIRAEQKIIKSNRLYLFISQINQMIVRTTQEETLFKEACKIAVEYGKFKMVWIGLLDPESNKITPTVVAGEDLGYIEIIQQKLANPVLESRGPVGTVIRSNKYVVCNDIAKDKIMQPWSQEALARGYHSLMCLPIKKFGKTIGVFNFYSSEKLFFDLEEINLLQEATQDVAFALEIIEKDQKSKKAEAAIYQSEKRYYTLTEASPVGIFRSDTLGNTTYVNPRWTQISGLTQQQALGTGWLHAVHKEDKRLLLKNWKKAIANHENFSFEFRFIRPDNTITWVMGQAIAEKNAHKEVVGYIGTVTEITKRKITEQALQRSEERYRGLLNNLDAGIVAYKPDYSIIMSNLKASELLGFDVQEMIINKKCVNYWEFLNDDGTVMAKENFPINQILGHAKPLKNFIIRINHSKELQNKWVLVNGFPILDEKGKIVEVVISFIDITLKRQMEIEINKSKEIAESANKAKTDFLANMSHEIRTPLNGIIGFTHLLKKSKLDADQSKYMATVHESAKSLMQIVNDVLDFSKIESGKLELHLERVHLSQLCSQVMALFQHEANTKNIVLELALSNELPKQVLVDVMRLKQVLVNLLSNALKLTDSGTIKLDVSVIKRSKNKRCTIMFSVQDTGIGIQKNNTQKIFDSFVQEDNSTSRKFGGTGLGLTISNQLLALMGSVLSVESEYGQGSNFFFTIQLQVESSNNSKSSSKKIKKAVPKAALLKTLGPKNILIVEDNKINMLLAKKLLKRILPNATIYEAVDGNEAVDKFKQLAIDIIFMDIQMPNKNGYQAATEIRAMQKEIPIPIIAITAGILAGEKEKCFQSGMNDYLPKPINISDLKKITTKWMY
ncbi:PAS domain S-box protein [Flavobacterium crassostreae]|uniref:Sensory/regulatory protein RpfC n=1 Tax=Flavobacterium crassostreae TaxID=1763534 RepID=A0A1B9E9D2_9FLAO|nr:PAS domain S-box protein [Flavobacterium crassostreae]OCB78546.1 hypothetical protein LPBF_00680 [Flavobacterium crassostreae]